MGYGEGICNAGLREGRGKVDLRDGWGVWGLRGAVEMRGRQCEG